MGKITAVHTGRGTTVKTAGGIIKRPIVKLVLLLQEEDEKNNSVLVGGMSESSA